MQTLEHTQTRTRLFPSLVPSRGLSPTPPITERPNMVNDSAGHWRFSSSTVGILDHNDDRHNDVQAQNHRHSIYGDNTSYDYGIPINYRTGAIQGPETLSRAWKSEFEEPMETGNAASASERSSRRPMSESYYPSLERSGLRSLQLPQDAYPARTGGLTKREQVLKRSTQLYPAHRGEGGGKAEGQENEHSWQSKWSLSSPMKYGKRVSSLLTTGPENSGSWNDTISPLSEKNRAQLQELFDKKKILQRRTSEKDARSSADEQLSALQDVDVRTGSRRKHWWHQPSGFIPLGTMVGFICLFMFAYNGVLSRIVFLASRFPSNTNLPVFIFSLLFILTTALSLLGFITSISFSRSNSNPNPSRAPHVFYRAFYTLYLCTSILTFGCMMGWLGLNALQTRSWDRMYLKSLDGVDSSTRLLAFESLLKPDMNNPNWWIINPWAWIAAFVAIWLVQVYSWVCLVAFGRRPQDWERIDSAKG